MLDNKTVNEYLAELGYASVKDFQKDVLYPQYVDGIYGPQTENALISAINVKRNTKNFSVKEFRCECRGKYCCGYPSTLKVEMLRNIQAIRDHWGRPVTVTCGLRDKTYNSKLGGSIQNSLHLVGQAVDFYQAGVTDTLANRKASIKWIKTLPNHHYTYGNGINSYGNGISAPYMGNALHTDVTIKTSPYDDNGKLICDGVGGTATVKEMQRFFGTTQDGIISGQNKAQNKYYPALIAVQYASGGSPCVRNLQRWVGTTQDGVLGINTVKAWQKKIGVTADGIFGTNSMKVWQKYLNEHDKAVYPTPSVDYYKVIDVSDWQGQIDWAKVKVDGVVGAIIRYGDGNVLDKRFAENMKNAKAAGLHIGSYIFSRAKTIAEAETEATRLFTACKPYAPDMPLYIDLEDASLAKYANVVAQAFLVKMKALGGRGGVYANLNWWNNYLADTAKNYSSNPFWIAQYNDTMDYKPSDRMGMWQYTSSGSVNGISGKVDMDKCYRAYWENPTIVERELEACKVQADWMKNAKYEYEKNPTVPKSKDRGTCVTYESCVLQRIGLIPSGQSLWHDENGKVYGANSNFTVIYPKNKTLSQLKNELKAGDIVMDGSGVGSGSHVFILTGKWNGSKPVIWDNWSGQKSKGAYTYDRDRHVIAIVRPK